MLPQKVTDYKGGGYSIPISHNDFYLHRHVQSNSVFKQFPYSTGIEISLLSEVSLPSVALVLGPKCAELYFNPRNAFMAYCFDTIKFIFICHRILLSDDRKFCGMYRVITVRTVVAAQGSYILAACTFSAHGLTVTFCANNTLFAD